MGLIVLNMFVVVLMVVVLFYIGPLSLSACITPLTSISNCFCALKIQDNSGIAILLINVYMPSQFSLSDYQDTISALEGFIESHSCDANIIVGDFNIDFSRVSSTSANYFIYVYGFI